MTTPTLAADVRMLELVKNAKPTWHISTNGDPYDTYSVSAERARQIISICNSAESHVKRLAALRARIGEARTFLDSGNEFYAKKLLKDALAADERAANEVSK